MHPLIMQWLDHPSHSKEEFTRIEAAAAKTRGFSISIGCCQFLQFDEFPHHNTVTK
jgi:hypothetical protein